MFASFTSILSPALKEKLGIGPKPSPPPGTCSSAPKPLSLPPNRTIRPLSSALQTEVQSPGFSSRLISQVREGSKPYLSDPGLSPLSMSVSTRYSRVGQLPVVTLTKRQLPRLTSRNSEKVGRREGRAPVMMRIAPQEPFSPFKRYPGSAERGGGGGSRGREGQGGSTDPRQVIAVLAELSGKRTRRPSDDLSITGSKRARRDSSSSLGSSLSMEMPPLFQNGVVGQSTSHLVSREADLSLGSLLSRNQSLFGHSPLSSHHSHPLPPTSLSHHHTVPTANATSQTVSAKPETSSDLAISLEIQASLSSSRCLLKRTRDQLEEDSEDEENVATPRAGNVFRSPDKDRDSAIRKRRQSSEGSCKSCGNNSTLVEGGSKSGSPEVAAGVGSIIVASPAEILGTPAPKRRRTQQMIGEKELRGERELQRKRLGKMLEIFPDQKALTPLEKPTETAKEKSSDENAAVSKPGGFPFELGEKFDVPPPAYESNKGGGFPFAFGSKYAADTAEVTAAATSTATSSPESTTTTSTPLSLGNISTSSTVTGNTTSTTNAPDLVAKAPAKPATVTFNLTEATSKSTSAPVSGLPVPKFSLPSSTEPDSVTTEAPSSLAAPTAVTSSSAAAPAVSSFGAKPADSKETKEKAAAPAVPFTFGAANFGSPVVSTAASSAPTETAPAVFSLGGSKALPTPSFNFGASDTTTATTTAAGAAPTFSLGQAAAAANTVPSFGSTTATTTASEIKPFSFGATATPASTKTEAPAPAAASGLFTFGAAAPAPALSTTATTFGAAAAVTTASSVATVSPFSFGATAAPATTASAPTGLFSFGSTPASTTTAAPSFGSTAVVTAAPSFGSAAPPSFSFGATPAAATTTAAAPTGGASFTFGAANPPAATTQSTPFAFGKASTEPPKPSFAFGGATSTTAAAANPFGAAAAPAPSFGAAPAASGFGAPATNAFGAAVVSTSANTFGATSVTKSASTGNVFSFGKSAPATQPAPAAAASPFAFGAAPAAQPSAAPAAGSPFQFGGSSSTPAKSSFSFGGSATAGAAPAFGAATAAPAFGAPAASTTPAFGSTQSAAPSQPPGVFSFGATSPPAAAAPPANSNAGFNFSAAPQNAAGVFSFGGAAPAAAAPQANPFGAPANPAPAFGAPNTNFGASPASFGATSPGFGAAAAPAPAGGNMFSIGAGGQQSRSSNTQRRIATARRTRKQ